MLGAGPETQLDYQYLHMGDVERSGCTQVKLRAIVENTKGNSNTRDEDSLAAMQTR